MIELSTPNGQAATTPRNVFRNFVITGDADNFGESCGGFAIVFFNSDFGTNSCWNKLLDRILLLGV
jgi:hypothetical protein